MIQTVPKDKVRGFGMTPAILLTDPRFSRNVSAVIRAASCFDVPQVYITGQRVQLELEGRKRLWREERMKGYKDVTLYATDTPFDLFARDVVPVGVELMPGAENIYDFNHPNKAVYVFGPEDGGLGKVERMHCHRFVYIPSKHCFNLAAAVHMVLYDRAYKLYRYTGKHLWLDEHRGSIDTDLDFLEAIG